MQVFPVPWLHDVKNMMSRPLLIVALIDFLIWTAVLEKWKNFTKFTGMNRQLKIQPLL